MSPPSALLIILLLTSLHLQTNSQHNMFSEQSILLRLIQKWSYSSLSLIDSWYSIPSPCKWPYVSCTDDMVTGLSLSQQNIVGTISSSICELKYIVRIDLSYNRLWGNIPACLRDCSNLQHLDLSWNNLSGNIPGQLFFMENLVFLSLSENRLHDNIATTIEKASSLESPGLSNKYLNGVISGGIAYSNNLTHLDLSANEFSGEIPCQLFLIESIVNFSLKGNRLHGSIPLTIRKASSLERLDLSNNNLNGSIPYGIACPYNLLLLDLSGNELNGEIHDLKASSLEWLDLSDNSLNGSIPDGIVYAYNLSYLNLSINQFSGEIPGALFLMENLVNLYLSGNRLHGNIPTTIEKAICLESLDLSNNSLCGSIPDSITYLHNLSHLDLSRNSFSGEIPTRLLSRKNGSNSYYLDLSDNQLSGEIRDIILHVILNSTLVAGINLCKNEFSGMVPDMFADELFPHDCLDPSNICYVNERLPFCPSSLCSYYKSYGYHICPSTNYPSTKKRDNSIITALGIAAGLGAGCVVLFCMERKCKKVLKSDPSMNEEEEWKMISFQGLKFETTDILSSLTDENLIGNGGSGKVYRVLMNQNRSYVAVKSISITKISDHRAEKEFLAEIQTLGAVWHYNIIKLLCYISGPDMKLLVYEYFDNKSLDRWLHGNGSVTKLDWPTRLNIAIGAAQGLCYMHHHCPIPIIHRDIKSSNILLDSEFNAKIADFGLAKLLNTCGDTETASVVAGTFGYIAPEYAYTSKVNAKSDVYSFGVVLLELTTGRKAVTRGDHLNLGGWAHLQCKDTSATIDALDDEIKEAAVQLDEVISVFRLGVVCTASLPSSRPSMKDCLHILMNCVRDVSEIAGVSIPDSGFGNNEEAVVGIGG